MKPFYKRPEGSTSRLFQDLADYHDKADKWGSAMGLFFDAVGEMSRRGVPIPAAYGYRGSPFGPDISEFNADTLEALEGASLCRLASFCHRLVGRLDRSGLSY